MPDITLVQTELHWESPAANRDHFDELLANPDPTDLVVLPEMFSTGFSMASSRFAEPAGGDTAAWMVDTARRMNAVVCGSVMTEDGGRHFNRFYWATPAGELSKYDKRHLFRMGEENENYSPGQDRTTFRLGELTVFPQVCYDLRFPVFSRNDLGFDLMLYVANWPAPRRAHWQTLLRARAIENQVFVVGVNRIGSDGNGVDYAGDSALIDFAGTTIVDLGDAERVTTVSIDPAALEAWREQFPAWKDADGFTLDQDPTSASQRSS